MSARELQVFFRERRVGVMSEAGAIWRFEYDPNWCAAKNSFDLSPALPRAVGRIDDGSSQRPVQWFFDNLLPEEAARELLAQAANMPQADAFGLLRYYGAESAGALSLLIDADFSSPTALQLLPDTELSARIRALPQQSLSARAPKRMSMAGAQHKLAAVLLGDQLHEPIGAAPSTVILKPDHVQVEQYPHSAANEWFCMNLARAAALPVPAVFLRYVPEPVYGVWRFDRQGDWPQVARIHTLDACQLLSLDRIFKYQKSTVTTLAQLVLLCREKARTRIALLRWSIFNALIGNGDAHLKNLSFFVDARGVSLAPHYDLLSTASYTEPGKWGAAELSQPMGDAKYFGDLRRKHVLDFGAALGIPAKVTDAHLSALLHATSLAAANAFAAMELGHTPVQAAGERRQIRIIIKGVLHEMCLQLS